MHFQHASSDKITVRKFFRCQNCDLIFQGQAELFSSSEEKLRYCGHENSELTQGYRSFLEPSVLEVKKIHQADWLGLDYGSGPYPALAQILLEHKINVDIYDPFFAPKIKRNSYDFLICTEVVEHFYHLDQDWEKMFSLMKSSGPLVVMTERHENVENFSTWHYWRDETHVNFYSDQTFSWIAEKRGYQCRFPHPRVVVFESHCEDLV